MEARLNFSDHPDGSFSCQAMWHGDYDPSSQAHQNIRILQGFVDQYRTAVGDNDVDDADAAGIPTLETKAHIHLTDVDGAFRLQLSYLPQGYTAKSHAHEACRQAHAFLEYINWAVTDAIITRPGPAGVMSVKSKQCINAENGNT